MLSLTAFVLGVRMFLVLHRCDSSAGKVKDYDALLSKSFRRHAFIAYVLYLIVAGMVTNCSIVTQIGIFMREIVSFTLHKNQDIPCKFSFHYLQFLSM